MIPMHFKYIAAEFQVTLKKETQDHKETSYVIVCPLLCLSIPCCRLPSSRPGSVHQLENLFKEEDEKPFIEPEEAEEEGEEEDVFVPPDGGYGWFVTLGAFISLFWTSGHG